MLLFKLPEKIPAPLSRSIDNNQLAGGCSRERVSANQHELPGRKIDGTHRCDICAGMFCLTGICLTGDGKSPQPRAISYGKSFDDNIGRGCTETDMPVPGELERECSILVRRII